MSWQISTHNIPHLGSYADALKVWKDATPWRNQRANWRPLAERKATHKRLVKHNGSLEVVLYNTAMVTYFPDGRIKLCSDDRQSSFAFCHRVLPAGVDTVPHRGNMFWQVRTPYGDRFYRADELRLIPAGDGMWVAKDEPTPATEVVLDRKHAAAVRKKLKPYTDWLKVTDRVMGPRAWHEHPYIGQVEMLLASPDCIDQYPEIREHGACAGSIVKMAYKRAGAVTDQPVPFTRLPRN